LDLGKEFGEPQISEDIYGIRLELELGMDVLRKLIALGKDFHIHL
jgi:hypothetical protein